MKLPGDPWNNRRCNFYGIAWNFSMELHAKCPNPPWKISVEKFTWNSMEIGVLILHGIPRKMSLFHGDPWRNFHGNWWPNPPWNSMENFPWKSRFFTREWEEIYEDRTGVTIWWSSITDFHKPFPSVTSCILLFVCFYFVTRLIHKTM